MPLIDGLLTTEALAEVFSDRSCVQAMLEFEAALARAEARSGAIPDSAARSITTVARAEDFDIAAIVRDGRVSATPAIPLVAALRERVRAVDPGSADFVHWGATSQDVTDTAMILLLKQAMPIVARDQARVERALRSTAENHAGTVMLGRTLLQPATPMTFGLKAASWYAGVMRSWTRVSAAWRSALVLQCGGAAGTRAALGEHASEIAANLAKELGVAAVPPWHTDRDRLGAWVGASGLYTSALGKIGRDIALLMQPEIAELAEPGGGSSTMPQKRNPAGCALVVAAALRMPGLVATFIGSMLQEQERSVGGSQSEWPTIASVVQTMGSAASAMATVLEGLTVDAARMRSNLEATGGTVFAERAVTLLAGSIGREAARTIVDDAIRRGQDSGTTFASALRANPDASRTLGAARLASIDDPAQYLGDAEALRRELLEGPGGSAEPR